VRRLIRSRFKAGRSFCRGIIVAIPWCPAGGANNLPENLRYPQTLPLSVRLMDQFRLARIIFKGTLT
jgi:hypothetical protein